MPQKPICATGFRMRGWPWPAGGDLIQVDVGRFLEDLERLEAFSEKGGYVIRDVVKAAGKQAEKASRRVLAKQVGVGIRDNRIPEVLDELRARIDAVPLAEALEAKASALRAASVSPWPSGPSAPSSPSVPVDGKRALGGPVKAGGTYQVNERGDEVAVFAKDGRVLSHADSMAAVSGGGGGVVIESLVVQAAAGMDENRLADLVLQRLQTLMATGRQNSYQNVGYLCSLQVEQPQGGAGTDSRPSQNPGGSLDNIDVPLNFGGA